MARLNIDTGIEGNSATGDTLRTAMTKINDNFLEVYTDLSDSGLGGKLINETTNGNIIIQPNGTGIVEVDQLLITDDQITSLITNNDLTLSGNGTGEVVMNSSLLVKGATPFVKIQRTDNDNEPGISFVGAGGTAGANILFAGETGTTNELVFQTFTVSGGIAEAFRVQQGGAKVTGSLDVDGGITIKDNLITASRSNDNLQLDATGTGAIEMVPAVIMMANLPTSDPSNAGQLYNDSGTVKISAG